MEAFYCHEIATISKISLVSFNTKSGMRNKAYIDIYEWHSTESAYNFIQRLKDPKRETKFVHNDDNWWLVCIGKKPFNSNIKRLDKPKVTTTINYLLSDTSPHRELLHWILPDNELSDTDTATTCNLSDTDEDLDDLDWFQNELELSRINNLPIY